jgi:hypothetical protein
VVEKGEGLVGDGDEVAVLVEDLEALGGGGGAEGGGAEVAAVADLGFGEGIDGVGGDVWEELSAGQEEGRELIGVGFEFGEGVGVGEVEVAAAGAAEGGDVGAAAEGLAEIVGEGADVGAGGGIDVELEGGGGEVEQGDAKDLDVDGLEFDGLVLAGELVGGNAVDLLGGDGGGSWDWGPVKRARRAGISWVVRSMGRGGARGSPSES